MLDFSRHTPEQLRGIPHGRPWDAVALEAVVQTMEGSTLKRDMVRRRLHKDVCRMGIECLPPKLRFTYCAARIARGDYSDYWGWEFRSSTDKETEDWSAHMFWDETWLPKWGGGPANRILVLGEQGIGDAIFHASMLPEVLVRANEVIFETDERLFGLLERSFPRLKCRPERDFEDRRPDYGEIDAFIPAADLMRMFRRSKYHFPRVPYLKPDPARVHEFRHYAGKTAVSWRGRQGWLDPMELGLELREIVSVQYGESHPDITEPEIDLRNDIEGVVAVLANCRQLVTVPTSVHHMAGAQGLRTSVIHPTTDGPESSSIRWDVVPGPSPYYPGLTVYQTIEDWHDVEVA